ncbi:MAG: hypothetical protein DIU71_12950 [Proteobacteria bacterium]|nr:MAG: hypothetical protein DIU71_12950 [Pseudomonadota bacterium]
MADDYLSDREQEEALRAWWRDNWSWIVGGIVLGLAVLFGWRYWEARSIERAEQAGELYSQLQTAATGDDAARAGQLLESLTAEYGSSAYTQQARLLVAAMHVRAGKAEEALPLLQAVVDEARDKELAQIARMRAARVLVELGRHDEALTLLEPWRTAERAGGFAARINEIRGDALFAKGDLAGARAAYQVALQGSDAAIDRSLLEMKLQDVGGETDGE